MSSLTADPWGNTVNSNSTQPPVYSYDEEDGGNGTSEAPVNGHAEHQNASVGASMAQLSYSEWDKVSITMKEQVSCLSNSVLSGIDITLAIRFKANGSRTTTSTASL